MNELTLEMIEQSISEKKIRDLRKYFEEYNSVDIAELINELSVDKLLFIFKTVPSEWSAEVFTYLDSEVQETLIKAFSGSDIENLIEELYSDELGYLDIHPFVLNEDGTSKQADLEGGWYEFEKDYFGSAFFEGKTIPCISLKGQRVFHSGYELRDKDKHDISILESLSK